jgi:hypothetical protein
LNLKVIENPCNGIGDAVMYCWMLHSLRAAGITDLRFNIRRWHEVGLMFGLDDDWLTIKPGTVFDGKTAHPAKGYSGRFDGKPQKGWLRAWLDGYGYQEVPIVRPPYVESKKAAEWADKAWADREEATGKKKRVLVFADVAWPIRQWPQAYFVDLAIRLRDEADCNIVSMAATEAAVSGFPFGFWGHGIDLVAAMIKRAHLVIGNDSGPAHLAGTLGVPTIAVVGGSRKDCYYDHVDSVRCINISPDTLPCVGCGYEHGSPHRMACNTGCRALYLLTPDQVYPKVLELL